MRVYIDGENARHTLSKILHRLEAVGSPHEMTYYPLRRLLENLLDDKNLEIGYYASKIKLPKGYEPSLEVLDRANQIKGFARKWVPQLADQNIKYIKAGYLKVKSGQKCPKCHHIHEVLQEKGVDVRIAVDIIDHAVLQPSQTIAVFSSDTDLTPAIDRVKKSGTRIIYIAYSEEINRAVSAAASETITFTGKKILQLYTEQN